MINLEQAPSLNGNSCEFQFMYQVISRWDYRSNEYPGEPKEEKHPNDLSVQTFIGHKVLRTLIRCRFSPEQTTGLGDKVKEVDSSL